MNVICPDMGWYWQAPNNKLKSVFYLFFSPYFRFRLVLWAIIVYKNDCVDVFFLYFLFRIRKKLCCLFFTGFFYLRPIISYWLVNFLNTWSTGQKYHRVYSCNKHDFQFNTQLQNGSLFRFVVCLSFIFEFLFLFVCLFFFLSFYFSYGITWFLVTEWH